MSAIVTSDLHLTSNRQDEYRWGIFDFLLDQNADELFLLGDYTVAKDRHDSVLVNRFIDNIGSLKDKYKQVILLAGNHDYIDKECPFFRFINGLFRNVHFVVRPQFFNTSIGTPFFIPSGTDWNEWKREIKDKHIFTHATFTGAQSENGSLLQGIDPQIVIDINAKVISGDIHKPQTLADGHIEYVGAPYHTRFGDDFEPRLILSDDDGKRHNLYYKTVKKHTIILSGSTDVFMLNNLINCNIDKGDHIRIQVELTRAALPNWKDIKQTISNYCKYHKWELFGPELVLLDKYISKNSEDKHQIKTPYQLIEDYAIRYQVSDRYLTIGKELIDE
jgi:predicted phosphodiesterase